jgi:hypothetical protein
MSNPMLLLLTSAKVAGAAANPYRSNTQGIPLVIIAGIVQVVYGVLIFIFMPLDLLTLGASFLYCFALFWAIIAAVLLGLGQLRPLVVILTLLTLFGGLPLMLVYFLTDLSRFGDFYSEDSMPLSVIVSVFLIFPLIMCLNSLAISAPFYNLLKTARNYEKAERLEDAYNTYRQMGRKSDANRLAQMFIEESIRKGDRASAIRFAEENDMWEYAGDLRREEKSQRERAAIEEREAQERRRREEAEAQERKAKEEAEAQERRKREEAEARRREEAEKESESKKERNMDLNKYKKPLPPPPEKEEYTKDDFDDYGQLKNAFFPCPNCGAKITSKQCPKCGWEG